MSVCCICSHSCGKPHLSCDLCKLPMHNKCLDLSDSELRVITATKSTHIKVFCNKCRTVSDSLGEIKTMMAELQASFDQKLKLLESQIKEKHLSELQKKS